MIDTEQFFYKIPNVFVNHNSLQQKGEPIKYADFDVIEIDKEPLLNDSSFFKLLHDKYEFTPGILVMKPFQMHKWHLDLERGVCINAIINDVSSIALFSPDYEPKKTDTIGGAGAHAYPLYYELNQCYLFNNQHWHSVYNLDETRYLFTLQFTLTKEDLSYEHLLKYIKKQFTNN